MSLVTDSPSSPRSFARRVSGCIDLPRRRLGRRRIGAMEISNSGKAARDGLAGAVDRGGAVRVRVMDHGRKDGGGSSMPSKRSTCGMLGT